MDVTETERLWIFGLLLQGGGDERGFIKDDIPEEAVSIEWMEEHEEEDSESWKGKHSPEGNRTVRNPGQQCASQVSKQRSRLRLINFRYFLHSSPQHTCVLFLAEAPPWQMPVSDSVLSPITLHHGRQGGPLISRAFRRSGGG